MMILPSGFGNHEHYHRGERNAIAKTGSYQFVIILNREIEKDAA